MPRPHLIPVLTGLLAALAIVPSPRAARADAPPVELETLHPAVDFASALRFAPDGRLFYTELASGRVMVFASANAESASVWAQVPVFATGERGLLGMTFHPDFPDSPYVFLFHTYQGPAGIRNRVVRLTDGGGVGASLAVILDDLPGESAFHHGGRLAFGPDRMLYVTFGDQANANLARDPAIVVGKILRVTSTGRPAPANPWGADNPACALGVRNPFGLCFDPLTGQGYFTENGLDCDDELNLLAFAADYGWDDQYVCGAPPAGTQAPLATFPTPLGLTGCTVYRGAVFATLEGSLLFGCFNDGAIRRAGFLPGRPDVIDTLEILTTLPDQVVLDLAVGPDGLVYVATPVDIRRILPAGNLDVPPGPRAGAVAIGPNPFRRALTLALPADGSYDRVEIVDLAGRRVRAWSGTRGVLAWDGRDSDGREVPRGIYFVRVSGPAGALARRVVRLDP